MQKNKNSIGYIEYSYAKQNHIAYTQLKNKSGKWVLPSTSTFKAAMSQAKWSASNGFYTVCVNEPGSSSWPIAGATFILVRKSTSNYTTAHAMFKFFDWGYKAGKAHERLGQLGLRADPVEGVRRGGEASGQAKVKAGGKAAW